MRCNEYMQLKTIGYIESRINSREAAPKMETEDGAVKAIIHVDPGYHDALLGLAPGSRITLLTWLHQADRKILQCYPRRDMTRPKKGVFATRSPNRPNPIGIHKVTIVEVRKNDIVVDMLEAIDGTPVVDIKSHW